MSKDGITYKDVQNKGLALRAPRVLGQVHPEALRWHDASKITCAPTDMPVLIFPRHAGDEHMLATVYQRSRPV